MGEQAKIDDGVAEWEVGLPSFHDLASLSQGLIPEELASAFRILPEPLRSSGDVNRASRSTLSSLRHAAVSGDGTNFGDVSDQVGDCEMSEPEPQEGSDPKKSRLMDPTDEGAVENFMDDQTMEAEVEVEVEVEVEAEAEAKALKRPRLVWTPELHRRFVEVVSHLGLKNAVPKTIMQLMNVEGLTRENVASHLQKYRLYVKRMQGLSNEGPSPSDHLFASTPVPPHSFNEPSNGGGPNHANGNHNGRGDGSSPNSHDRMPVQMPYPPLPHAMPISVMGMAVQNMNSGYEAAHSHHHHYQQHYNNMMQEHNNMMQEHNNMMQQQLNWSGNMYNSHLQHLNQNNK